MLLEAPTTMSLIRDRNANMFRLEHKASEKESPSWPQKGRYINLVQDRQIGSSNEAKLSPVVDAIAPRKVLSAPELQRSASESNCDKLISLTPGDSVGMLASPQLGTCDGGTEGHGSSAHNQTKQEDFSRIEPQALSAGLNHHVLTNPPQDVFQENVSALPPEICKMIMDILFENIFGPKNVHTQTDTPVKESFLALNKQLYHIYKEVYWSDNTWIVGKGSPNKSMRFMTVERYDDCIAEFSKQNPNQAALKIRRLEMCFCKEDLKCSQAAKLGKMKETSQSIEELDQVEENQMIASKDVALELMQIWQDKFDRIAFLQLEHLTLDFTGAYAPCGVYLGVAVAQRLMPFVYGLPRQLKITAPTKGHEDEIRTVFLEMNKSTVVPVVSVTEGSA